MSTPSLSDGQLTPTDTDPDLCFSTSEDDLLWPTAQDVTEMAIMIQGSAVPLSWSRDTLKRLPRGTRPLKLVGEGAANVVFELALPKESPSAHEFKGTTSASPLSHSRLTRVSRLAPSCCQGTNKWSACQIQLPQAAGVLRKTNHALPQDSRHSATACCSPQLEHYSPAQRLSSFNRSPAQREVQGFLPLRV